jgi:hypothetical protein
VTLDNNWVFSLTQDFEEIIITNEIETREYRSLLFKEIVQGFLAHIKLSQNCLKSVFKSWDLTQGDNFWIGTDTKHDTTIFFIDTSESSLLLRKGTSHENGLKINPLTLNDI